MEFTTAAVILAEIGFDMSRFPSAAHLVSWAGLCPGSNESAGKRFSGTTRKGNRYLRRVLTQSAWSVKRKKNCSLTSLFWRVAGRGGQKKAALAVAHRLLTIAWHIIAEGGTYQEVGANCYEKQHPDRSARRLVRRLEQLGFEVDAKPKRAAASAPPLSVTNPPGAVLQERVEAAAPTQRKRQSVTAAKQAKPKFQKTLVRRKRRTPTVSESMTSLAAESTT